MHEDARGPRVLFVINPEKSARDAEVVLPAPMAFVDALTGERLEGDRVLTLRVPAQTARMLLIDGATVEPAKAQRAARPRARRVSSGGKGGAS